MIAAILTIALRLALVACVLFVASCAAAIMAACCIASDVDDADEHARELGIGAD